jgi:hypothetical protein
VEETSTGEQKVIIETSEGDIIAVPVPEVLMTKVEFRDKIAQHYQDELTELKQMEKKLEEEVRAKSSRVQGLQDCIEQAANKVCCGWCWRAIWLSSLSDFVFVCPYCSSVITACTSRLRTSRTPWTGFRMIAGPRTAGNRRVRPHTECCAAKRPTWPRRDCALDCEAEDVA